MLNRRTIQNKETIQNADTLSNEYKINDTLELELWLKTFIQKEKKLNKILSTLKQHNITKVSDLTEKMKNKSDIDEFMKKFKLSFMLKKKLKIALELLIEANVNSTQNEVKQNPMSTLPKTSRMDAILCQYYKCHGRNDYINKENNKGKFIEFVEVNGFDEKDIEKDFEDNTDPDECSFIDMDDNFPLQIDIKNVFKRNKQIFKILQYIYKYVINYNENDIEWLYKTKFSLLLKPGFNIIPSERDEYILPELKENEYVFQGGKGYTKKTILINTTIRNSVCNVNDDIKQQDINIIKEKNEGKPKRIFAEDKHKIILICGKTGTGKTTLINSMMNYIYGIDKDNKFRVKLIEEEKRIGGNAVSCTDHISSYKIKQPIGGNIDYDLTIIDTPGFADSRGIKKDQQTLEAFKYIFENALTDIHAICFIVKASDNRLDANQTYVFNNILNLWAKDVIDNIFILMTFADGGTPNCIDAFNENNVLKNCKQQFKLNNSAFKWNPTNDKSNADEFYPLFWKIGMKCFTDFICTLATVEPKAIKDSKEVLRKRSVIQCKIHDLVEQLDIAMLIQRQVVEKKHIIRKKQEEVDAGKQVWFETYETIFTKEKTNRKMLSCTVHKQLCHHCDSSDSDRYHGYHTTKTGCIMFNRDGICESIGCGCDKSKHEFFTQYIKKMVKVKKSSWDTDFGLKEKQYEEAKHSLSKSEQILQTFEEESKKNVKNIEDKLAKIQNERKKLEEIALRPKLTTFEKYIDELIELEKKSQSRDKTKMDILNKLKKIEDAIAKLQQADNPTAKIFGF